MRASRRLRHQAVDPMLASNSERIEIKTTYCLWASAAGVDQLSDGVAVVGEVLCEELVGIRIAVVLDERLEIVGDLLCLGQSHAWRLVVAVVSTLDEWVGESGNGKEAGNNGERTHFD